jgi:hypothetical protein
MTEIRDDKLELLKQAIDVQERMLDGCLLIFKGFRQSSDPEVVLASETAAEALENTHDVLEALIDRLDKTIH